MIQAIWDRLYLNLDGLQTVCGRRVDILNQGTWNFDEGPDFLGATLRIDGEVQRGDVEIHYALQTGFVIVTMKA